MREIKEETGLDISNYKIELVDDLGRGESEKTLKETGEKVLCRMRFFVYKVEIADKLADEIGITLGDDLAKFAWTPGPELKNPKLTPPSRELFGRMGWI